METLKRSRERTYLQRRRSPAECGRYSACLQGFGLLLRSEVTMDGPGKASLLSLPLDATLRTMAFLDICDLFSVVSTCKALRDLGRVCLPPEWH
jgi:hypothetical protein